MKKIFSGFNKQKWVPFVFLFFAFFLDIIIFNLFKNAFIQEALNIVSIIMYSAVLFYIFKKSTTSRTILIFLVLSYLIKVVYIYLDVYLDVTYKIFNDYVDSMAFNKQAINILNGTVKPVDNLIGQYPVFLAYFYKIFGINRLMAQHFNVMVASLTLIIFLGIGKMIKIEEKKMIFPMLILCFFPLSIPYHSMLIRDSIIIFLLSLIILLFIKWYIGGKQWTSIVMLSIFVPIMMLHEGFLALLPVFLFFIAFFDRKTQKIHMSWKSWLITGTAFSLLVILFIFFDEIFYSKLDVLKTDTMNSIYLHLERNFGASAYLTDLHYDSIWDIILYSIPRMFYFMFSPLPWQWRGILDAGAFLFDAMFYLLFTISIIPMYRGTSKNKRLLLFVFILQFILLVFVFSQGTFTAGAALRHRFKSLLLILVIYILSGDGDPFSISRRWKSFMTPITYFIRCNIGKRLSDETYIKLDYRFAIGKKLNLQKPVYFTEKLQWLKLYDRKPEYRELADKYKARDYINQKFGDRYLFPLYGVYKNYEEINFDELPNRFVLKPNHTSGDYFLCSDKSEINYKKLRRMINRWLKRDFYLEHREWQYKDINPIILCEEYMEDEHFGNPLNYKFFCFHGKPEVLLVTTGINESRTGDFFDIDFNPLEVYGKLSYEGKLHKPEVYDELVEMVRKIATPFLHVRIDTYIIGDKIYFGEFTFHHYSGLKKWKPEGFDLELGSKLKLPI